MKEVKETVSTSTRLARVEKAKPEIRHSKRQIKSRYHTVQNGDTLWTISQRYGLRIDKLKKANRIRGNDIRPGQKLIIST